MKRKQRTANTGFKLLLRPFAIAWVLRLGLIWTLGLLSFFHFITFYFQKFSVYLFTPVTKAATGLKPENVSGQCNGTHD